MGMDMLFLNITFLSTMLDFCVAQFHLFLIRVIEFFSFSLSYSEVFHHMSFRTAINF